MKNIYLSRHTIRRMRLYDITLEQISQTLSAPDHIVPSLKERYNAYRRIGERFLRVTYREEKERYVVVTVTPRKRF